MDKDSGGAAAVGAKFPDLDQQEYIEELKRTFVSHRTAVRGVLEQLTTKLEGLQRDHIDEQERIVAQFTSGALLKEASVVNSYSIVPVEPQATNHAPPVYLPRAPSRGSGNGVAGGTAPGAKVSEAWENHPNAVGQTGSPVPAAAGDQRPAEKRTSGRSSNSNSKAGRKTSMSSVESLVRRESEKSMIGAFRSTCRQIHEIMAVLMEYSKSKSKNNLHWSQRVVQGFIFKSVTTFAILLNAVCIGVQTDQSLSLALKFEEDKNNERLWVWIEILFTIFFTGELLLRALAERFQFLVGKNYTWNLFDLLLVSTSLVGIFVESLSDSDRAPDFSFARMLRLIRFTRVLRLLRALRFSESLRLMIFSILASIGSLFWIWIILFFTMYFWAVFFLSGIIEHYTDKSGSGFVAVDKVREAHFDSVFEAILALFMCITGGRDWYDVVSPLWDISPWYTFFFTVYIFFMALGVLNVVVGSFVDNAQQVSRNDRDLVVKNEIKQEKEYMARIRSIFSEADKDDDGSLSWEEFEEYLKDDRVAAYLGSLGLDSSIARTLFVLLDVDDTNSVGIDEFVGGCLRLKGQARSIDVNMLLYNSEKMICKTSEVMEEIGQRLVGIEQHLGVKSKKEAARPNSALRPLSNAARVEIEEAPPVPRAASPGPQAFSHRDASAVHAAQPESPRRQLEKQSSRDWG